VDRAASLRIRGWVSWGVIAASWILHAGTTYIAIAEIALMLAAFNVQPSHHVHWRPPLAVSGLCAVAGAVFLGACMSRRVRAVLRMRPRLSRPSAHGPLYLDAFALWTAAWVVATACFALLDVLWIPLLYLGMVGAPVAIVSVFLRARTIRTVLRAWGWQPCRRPWREIVIGVVAGFVLYMARRLPGSLSHPSAADSAQLWGALRTIVWTPVVEETFHRGLLYRHLRDRLRWPAAAVASAAIFAMFHLPVWRWPWALAGGLVYAGLREWRGSLLACVSAHATGNLLFELAALPTR